MFRTSTLLSILLIGATIIGCSRETTPVPQTGETARSTQMSPGDVAKAFLTASNSGDLDTFESLLTQKAREGLNAGNSGPSLQEGQFESFSVDDASISGDLADVPVTTVSADDGAEQKMTLKMRLENTQWRVYGVAMKFAEDMSMTINFETIGETLTGMVQGVGEALTSTIQEGFGQMTAGPSPEEFAVRKARFDGLASYTTESYEAQWTNTIDYRGRTAGESLGELCKAMDLGFFAGEHDAALSENVGADVTGLSRLEAVERIAAEAGFYPVYPEENPAGGIAKMMVEALAEGMGELVEGDPPVLSIEGLTSPTSTATAPEPPVNAVRLEPGERPYPIAFSGPFVLEVQQLTETPPYGTGSITFAVRAHGIDGSLLALINQIDQATMFDTVEDEKGRPLIDTDVTYMSSGELSGNAWKDAFTLSLHGMVREVTEIARVNGRQKFALPKSVHDVEFSDMTPGTSSPAGDMTVELKQAGTYTRFDVHTPANNAKAVKVMAWAEDASGTPIDIQFHSTMAWGDDKASVDLNLASEPSTIRLKVIADSEVLEYPLELTGIPLTRYAEMVEKIEPLSFGEHAAPVNARFIEVTDPEPNFTKVKIELTNYSNKDVMSVFANFVYLDATGAELEDFPSTISGAYSFEGQEPAVAANATSDTETTAFQMPEGTTDIRIEIISVDFNDGTKWQSETL